jgi:hypothetical protein
LFLDTRLFNRLVVSIVVVYTRVRTGGLIMKNRTLWVCVLAVCLAAGVWGQGVDPGAPDTLFVGSVQTYAGQKASVQVNFFNDEQLAALTIPLTWDSDDITLDTVVFTGGRIDYLNTQLVTIVNDSQKVVFGAVVFLEAYIAPGRGLMVTLVFNIPPGTPDQFVKIDTTTRPPASLMFTNKDASNFTPVMKSGKLTIGNPPVYPHIVLAPTSLSFDGIVGYPNPAGKAITVTNTGGGTMSWSATNSKSWLTVNPHTGTAPSTISANINIAGLAKGTYRDTVVFTAPGADNTPQRLPVTLTMTQLPPTIRFSPASFAVSGVQGGANPADRYLKIWTDVPGSELSWTVAHSSSWLTLSPASGMPPDSVRLQFDITGLPFGQYSDTIIISDPHATNNPQRVPVSLQVVSDLPVLTLDPQMLHVNVPVGTNAMPKIVRVYNAGEGFMTFQAEEHSTRIGALVPTSGTAPQEMQVLFSTITTRVGEYYDTITVTSPEAINSPQLLIVHFHVSANPARIVLFPSKVDFISYECWQGVEPIPGVRTVQITNLGEDPMEWRLTKSTDWLVVSDTAGAENTQIILSLNAQGFPVGTYYDTIYVWSDQATISPVFLPVTLRVIPGTEQPVLVFSDTSRPIPAQEVFGSTENLFAATEVMNYFPGCMNYRVEEDIPWLTIFDTTGAAPQYLLAGLEMGDFTYGVYPDSFYVYSDQASNSPLVMHLQLLVWRLHGDANWSNQIDVADVVYLINFIFRGGPGPEPEYGTGDCNCNDLVSVDDVILLINYIFKSGTAPCGNL